MKPPPSDDKALEFEGMQDIIQVGKSLKLNRSEVPLRTDYFIDLVFNSRARNEDQDQASQMTRASRVTALLQNQDACEE